MTVLHVDRFGNTGEPLLFIHGWGMHSGMWSSVLSQLAGEYRVMAVDLPGHGLSAENGQWITGSGKNVDSNTDDSQLTTYHLDSLVDQLSAQFTEPVTVCGWSLGGQLALRWAERFPEQIKRLVLVASTPCFVQRDDWLCAMEKETLNAFAALLQKDFAVTLRRFLALQARGSEQERELLINLRHLLQTRPEPDLTALQSGLALLRDVDLREILPLISQPSLVVAGVRDTLTPFAASQYLATHLPFARLAAIAGAAHTPFLSHSDIFIELMRDFLHE